VARLAHWQGKKPAGADASGVSSPPVLIRVGNRIHMRAVQRAAEIADGVIPIAIYLGVAPAVVAAWIKGTTDVPPGAFLKVVELIVEHGPRMRGVIPPSLVESFKHRPAANG